MKFFLPLSAPAVPPRFSWFSGILCGAFALALMGAAASKPASAQILLDAEMEEVMRAYADPIILAAGHDPDLIEVLVIGNEQINALASPGLIQLYSGLILQTQNPTELQGVLAHEVAHIVGGHIARGKASATLPGVISIASFILGMGAVAVGLPEVGILLIGGGPATVLYQRLGTIRAFEATADQAAITYLNNAQLSGRGLITFFKREFAPYERFLKESLGASISPYILTHPLSVERLGAIQRRVQNEPPSIRPDSREKLLRHEMIKAKLFAFLKTPQETFARYPLSSNSKPARYAHALTFSKSYQVERALEKINSLIQDEPQNPFFHELKGYILTRGSRVEEAMLHYEKAGRLAQDNPILNLEIGRAILAADRKDLAVKSIPYFQRALRMRKLGSASYLSMATAYDRIGDRGKAALATAEAFVRRGNYHMALLHTQRALKDLSKQEKVSRLRAEDIVFLARSELSRQEEKERR